MASTRILQFITYLLVPAGLLTIYTQLFTTHVGWRESVLRMVGALVPMKTEGLVLMTSDRLRRRGGRKLGQRQCLVQKELPAIEVGAGGRGLRRQDRHTDESGMRVCEVEELDGLVDRKVSPMCWPPWPPPTRPSQREHAGNHAEAFPRRRAGSWPRTRLSSRPPSGRKMPPSRHGN